MAKYVEVRKIFVISGRAYLNPVQAGIAFAECIAATQTHKNQKKWHSIHGTYAGFEWYAIQKRLKKKAYRRVKDIFKNAYERFENEV